VHRIQLENDVFEGRNAIYLFGADGAGPTTLVDTGVASAPVREELRDGLASHGVGVEDLDRILVTHYHADHAGLAGELRADSGATVHAHRADARLVARDPEAWASLDDRHQRKFEAWGMPENARAELVSFLEAHDDVAGDPATVDAFDDGATFQAGEVTLEAVHLSGHTAGLCGFAGTIDGESVLLSGDALLPKYTPNVGGADVRVENPLARYLETLGRIVEADYDRAYPGHRDPIEDPTRRAKVIRRHHRERTEHVVDVLREHGPADAWTVSAHLFGDLRNIHILHGPGEAAAHLEHLIEHGAVALEDAEYRLLDPDPDVADLFHRATA
jgi:hydroxyacylglutathione hydrolase